MIDDPIQEDSLDGVKCVCLQFGHQLRDPNEFMRRELGKPTREYFFAELAKIAPDFRRCTTYDIKGFTWSLLHHQGQLYQWLWFQRHKYDDAFTVELSWSCLTDEPTQPPFRDPADSFSSEGARMRLGALWNNRGDYWWYVADAPPGILDVSPEEWLNKLAMPRVVDLEKALPQMHRAVDDAIGRVRDYALPYFSRVDAWARGHSCEPSAPPSGRD